MKFDGLDMLLAQSLASSHGGSNVTVESLSITENGTYTASTGKAYSPVTVAVTPLPSPILAWNFKSETPLIDTVRGVSCSQSNVTFSAESGAHFGNAACQLTIPSLGCGMTIEIDVESSNVSTSGTRNFVVGSSTNGLWYSSAQKWMFKSEDTGLTDPNYFAEHTLKIEIDSTGKWKIYRDSDLLFSSSGTQVLNSLNIGFGSNAIFEINISAVRIY